MPVSVTQGITVVPTPSPAEIAAIAIAAADVDVSLLDTPDALVNLVAIGVASLGGLVRTSAAARHFGVSATAIRDWVRIGMPHVVLPGQTQRRFWLQLCDAWVMRHYSQQAGTCIRWRAGMKPARLAKRHYPK